MSLYSSDAIQLKSYLGYYPLTGTEIERRQYDSLVVKKWKRKHHHKGTIRAFALEDGGAFLCGSKVFADIDVRIIINGQKKRFFVDPHDTRWFDRIRSHIAIVLGIGEEKYPAVRLFVGGKALTGVPEDLVLLQDAPSYTILVTVITGRDYELAVGTVLPPPSRYELPRPSFRTYVVSEDAASGAVKVEEVARSSDTTPGESRRAIRELMAKLEADVTSQIPARVAAMDDRDYGTVKKEVLVRLADDKFYGGKTNYNAFWSASKCPNIASAITNISSDIASRLCKAQESIQGRPTIEIYQKSLIGCSIWDEWRGNMKRWHRSKSAYIECPTDSPGCGYSDEQLQQVTAPIGSAATAAVQDRLIASSFEYPYHNNTTKFIQGKHHHHVDHCSSESSDDKPSHHSMAHARKKKHYRTHYRGGGGGENKRQHHKDTTYEEVITIIPIEGDHLALIQKKQSHGHLVLGGKSSEPKPGFTRSHESMPHGSNLVSSINAQINALQPIACSACPTDSDVKAIACKTCGQTTQQIGCKTCGHGCMVCGTKLCTLCGKCPRCGECTHSCKNCGNQAVDSIEAKLINCSYCGHKGPIAAADAPPLPIVRDPEDGPANTGLISSHQGVLPSYEMAHVSFSHKGTRPQKVTFHMNLIGRSYQSQKTATVAMNDTSDKVDVNAGRYSVKVEDSDTHELLAELKDATVHQRNVYTFRFQGKKVIQDVDRLVPQKKKLVSDFLSDPSVKKYLESHPTGVLFAPDNATFSSESADLDPADYFVSGENPEAMLLQKQTNTFDDTQELILSSDSRRSKFIRTEDGTKIWASKKMKNERIHGSFKHPDYTNVVVIIVGASSTEFRGQ